jgi:hypothetical protein
MSADRMDILTARSYTARDGEKKTAFSRIGTAWPMKNGGWRLTFEAIPVPSLNDKGEVETTALMMEPKPRDDAPRQSNSSDSVPF